MPQPAEKDARYMLISELVGGEYTVPTTRRNSIGALRLAQPGRAHR